MSDKSQGYKLPSVTEAIAGGTASAFAVSVIFQTSYFAGEGELDALTRFSLVEHFDNSLIPTALVIVIAFFFYTCRNAVKRYLLERPRLLKWLVYGWFLFPIAGLAVILGYVVFVRYELSSLVGVILEFFMAWFFFANIRPALNSFSAFAHGGAGLGSRISMPLSEIIFCSIATAFILVSMAGFCAGVHRRLCPRYAAIELKEPSERDILSVIVSRAGESLIVREFNREQVRLEIPLGNVAEIFETRSCLVTKAEFRERYARRFEPNYGNGPRTSPPIKSDAKRGPQRQKLPAPHSIK